MEMMKQIVFFFFMKEEDESYRAPIHTRFQ